MTSGLAKMSDDDLRRLGTEGLIQRLRDTDDDRIQALRDNTSLMKEINHKMQVRVNMVNGNIHLSGLTILWLGFITLFTLHMLQQCRLLHSLSFLPK